MQMWQNVNSWGIEWWGGLIYYSFNLSAGLKFFKMKSWWSRKEIYTNNIKKLNLNKKQNKILAR